MKSLLLTTAILTGTTTTILANPLPLPLPLPLPTSTLISKAPAASFCGQWDSEETGPYTIYNNLWGMDAGTGEQCTSVDGLNEDDDSVAWSTSWSWSGGSYNVKSYANVVVKADVKQISDIASIPSSWKWDYAGNDIIANVAYDLFTSSSADGSSEYEVMIWLAALGGAGPISETGSPVASPNVAGSSWSLYEGYNGDMHVFSFVASSQITDFSGDLTEFLSYLGENNGLETSQYLTSVGAGTEPFTGSDAVLTTTAYQVSVN
ncbi:family 12 glycosyl hydrolase [Poronia punctata]|nr:family 12 glycosyl hydrolase [Poronia punctata]